MISNLSVSVPFQRGRDTAVYCNGKIGDDYIWVILHVVLDPVQHKSHKGIFIEICKEFLVFVAHVHAFGFFVYHVYKKIIGDAVQVVFHLFTADGTVNIENQQLILLNFEKCAGSLAAKYRSPFCPPKCDWLLPQMPIQ